MSDRNAEATSSRTAWGMVIGAISLATAWAWRQLHERRSKQELALAAHPAASVKTDQASVEHPHRVASSGHAPNSTGGSRELTPREGSSFSQLKEDFARFPPKELAKRLWAKISEDEVTTLSTSFAYYWVFAIPALLILVVMIAAIMNRATDVAVVENLRDLINDRAPADSRQLLRDLVDNAVAKVDGGTASFGAIFTALLALWSGSSAVGILITGFNRAYDVDETRPFVRKKLLTIGLTLVLVVFVNLAFALLIFGEQLGSWIADKFRLGGAFDLAWTIARWPIAIVGIMLLGAVMYWAGPNVKQPFRWVSLGSVVATVLWLILVAGFGLYLLLSNPGSAYGVVGSVIVLLVFLNFTGIIFFLGAEVSAILARAESDGAEEALAD